MILDALERSLAIRKRIRQKYCLILLIYIIDILVLLFGYIFLYWIFKRNGVCPFSWFLVFTASGEFVAAGFTGLIQLISVHKRKREYSVKVLIMINIILCLICIVFQIISGIRPQKIFMLVLGIILSVILIVIIFFIFGLLYHKVNTFNKLYEACEVLEQRISDYGGIEVYNQYAGLYNKMNSEIKCIGSALGEKDSRKKYVKKREVMKDLEEMLRKIPALSISEIRICTFGRLDYFYRIWAYIRGIYNFSADVDKMLGKAVEQVTNIKAQIEKKAGYLMR